MYVPLVDPSGRLSELQQRVRSYPDALRQAIIKKFLWEADFQLDILEKITDSGDTFFVQAAKVRVLSCLVQVLYALDRRWYLNEKRAVAEVARMPLTPENIVARIDAVMTADPSSLLVVKDLLADVQQQVNRVLP